MTTIHVMIDGYPATVRGNWSEVCKAIGTARAQGRAVIMVSPACKVICATHSDHKSCANVHVTGHTCT